MYFIWGEEEYLIDFQLNNIIEEIGLEPIIFDSDSENNEIIAAIDTVSLFEEKKLIVLKNLKNLRKKNFTIAEDLFNSIKNSSESTELIFTLKTEKPIYTNHLVKFLLNNAKIIEVKKYKDSEIVKLIMTIINKKGGQISNKAALKLAINLPNNLLIINQEINKLIFENNDITEDMIDRSISKYTGKNIFALSHAIVSGDSLEILKAYKSTLSNDTPINIINKIFNDFKLAMIIEVCKKLNYSFKEISNLTSIHIYRIIKINKILENQFAFSVSEMIIQLSKLDNDIKNGISTQQQSLDHFILNIIRKK